MSCTCGCCEGVHAVTPAPVANRPGLAAIRTRIGTHASFLQTMLARLSSAELPELAALRSRDGEDPAIALIDAWATVADVLTFYQERIANEGYLRTATERRSLVELARLIGYEPRPGVAASVHLAFTLEKDAAPVVIPKGSKANSVPGPGETMEAFETGEAIEARFELGAILPRRVQPQTAESVETELYLKGIATRLEPGDMLLLFLPGRDPVARRIATVKAEPEQDRTHIRFTRAVKASGTILNSSTLKALLRARARAPANASRLDRSVQTSFATRSDTLPQLLAIQQPALAETLYPVLSNIPPPAAQQIEVHAMRIEARPFGHNAPLQVTGFDNGDGGTRLPILGEWNIAAPWGTSTGARLHHESYKLYLDNDYDVEDGTFLVIDEGDGDPIVVTKLAPIRHLSLSAYGLSGKSIELAWDDEDDQRPWLGANATFDTVRSTRVYLGSEKLELAEAPIDDDVAGDEIELDAVYAGLAPGRWLIVEGERTDIPDAKGVPIRGIHGAELVMLSAVEQGVREVVEPGKPAPPPPSPTEASVPFLANNGPPPGQGDGQAPPPPPPPPKTGPQPGDTYHTTIRLAAATESGEAGLAYRYRRDTVIIHANVAPATHGETVAEVMGSGDAAQALQRFALKQPPLTRVSAATPSGIASTLEVRVNDLLWHEAPTLAVLGPEARAYLSRTGDDGKTEIVFGNGRQGMRLPTGRDNVKARYRRGIGAPGNVKAGQISLLGSRPLGVKEVINPIRASGGADREGSEAIRRNAPIAIMALDRLLSTRDYADFARSFGGVGKAAAWRDKGKVHVIVAGVDDAPIDESSDLFRNLKASLRRFGDPAVPIGLKVSRRRSLVLSAGIRLEPDYLWESVEPKLRAALLAAFSFDAHELGEPLFLASALRAIQGVRGVLDADVDVFDALTAGKLIEMNAGEVTNGLEARQRLTLDPDEIAYLSAAVPDTLILQELTS